MSLVKRSNFHLKKLKYLKDKFVVEATLDKINGDTVNQVKWGVNTTIVPHEDLRNILMAWSPLLAKSWGFDKKTAESVKCTGIGIEQKADGDVVTLTGNYTTPSGYVRGFSSPPISLNDDYYKFEEILEKDVENIKDEAFAFYSDDKQADLQLTTDGKES